MPALRASSAHPATIPTEEPTRCLLSPWKRQVSPTSSAESDVGIQEQPPCLQEETGLEELVLLGEAAGTGVRAQGHCLAPTHESLWQSWGPALPWERFDGSSFSGLLQTPL